MPLILPNAEPALVKDRADIAPRLDIPVLLWQSTRGLRASAPANRPRTMRRRAKIRPEAEDGLAEVNNNDGSHPPQWLHHQ